MENKKAWTITLSIIALFMIGSLGAAYILVPEDQKPPIIIIDNDTKPIPEPVKPNDTKPLPPKPDNNETKPLPPIIIDNKTDPKPDIVIPPIEPFQHNFSERTVLDN